jgi:ribosomal subunit interface protein
MRIDMKARGFALTQGLRAHVEQRLQFALNRFQDRLTWVAVRLSDVNGPKGGVDKLCQLQLCVHGLPDIIVKDTEADLYVAVDRAAERAGRMLQRHLRRAHGNFDYRPAWRDE